MKYVKPERLTEQSLILDVRTPDEIREEALSLPFFNEELSKLNPRDFVYEHNLDGSKTLNIICHSGSRSQRAAELFEKNGFFNVTAVWSKPNGKGCALSAIEFKKAKPS